jgi:serine/threonine-protein kinase
METATPLIPPPLREIALGDHRRVRMGVEVGRGAIARVHRGVFEGPFGIERAVAVKVFDVLASDDFEIAVGNLGRAARDAACIQHPNVVGLYEMGAVSPGQPFVVLELVEGRSLASLIDSCARAHRRVPLDVALFIGIEVADALAGARLARTPEGIQLNVVHGELSASDVLLSWQGEVKVGDFGFGAAARSQSSVRRLGAFTQRLRVLAPEVAHGGVPDSRADVFSLGVLLREMLVGPRFPAGLPEHEALAWVMEGLVHSSVFEPQLAPELRALVARALDRDPARRFPHAGVFAYELRRVALTMGVADARTFLRHAMPKLFTPRSDDDEVTGEVFPGRISMSDGDDRFARLRGERTSGLIRKALRAEGVDEDPAADDEEEEA